MTAAATDAARDPLQQFRSWASVLFALLGAVALIVGALLLPSPSPPESLVVLVATGVGAAIFIVVSLAIGRGGSWAIHAIVPICVFLICAGLLRAAAAFTRGEVSVPLEVLGAIAVLSRPHAPDAMPALTARGRRSVWLAVGGLLVSQLLPYAASPVLGSAVFGAQEDELALDLKLDCPDPSDASAAITARTSWGWARGVSFAPPNDGLLIQWFATTGDGAVPNTAVLAARVSDRETMTGGSSSSATDTILDSFRSTGPDPLLEPFRSTATGYVDVLISRSGSELQDGWVEVDVAPNDVPPETLEFRAIYAHGDRWVQRSEPAFCS